MVIRVFPLASNVPGMDISQPQLTAVSKFSRVDVRVTVNDKMEGDRAFVLIVHHSFSKVISCHEVNSYRMRELRLRKSSKVSILW